MPEIVQRGLRCHSLSSATECPSERREPDDRQHNSAGHCTPYRWFHPGMDLHVVTLAWEKGFLRFQINQEPLARGEPAKIDSETTQTTPALRLSISATVLADQAVGVPSCPEAGKDNHRSIEGA